MSASHQTASDESERRITPNNMPVMWNGVAI
jgi:hypothetical protein